MAKTKAKAEKAAPVLKRSFWSDDRKLGYILGAVAFLLYIQSVGFNYALDDRAVLYSNKYVTDGFGGFGKILSTFYWAGFWDSNAGLFRPVSLLLFATEWQIFGDKPGVFHFVHTTLFAVLSMQLFLFLRELFKNHGVTLAFLATLLWILMPIHTEVGANLKSADEILSLLFSCLAFRYLLKWKDKNFNSALLLSCVFFFLALLSKEGAVLMLPIALLLLFQFREMSIRELLLPAMYLFGVSLIWFAYHYAVISNAPTAMIDYDYHNNALLVSDSYITRLGTAIAIQGHYIAKMIVGYPLSYNYSFNEIPVNGFADVWAIGSLLLLVGSLVWAVMNIRKNSVPAFGILFYFIAFALTSNIFYLLGETMGDRLAFVPSVGFAILLAWGIVKVTGGLDTKGFHSRAITASLLICIIWAGLSFNRSKAWAYESTLFTTDVEHSPGSARVHYNYGVLLMGDALNEKDEIKKNQLLNMSYAEFTTAVAIDSNDIQSCVNLGVVEFRRKNYKESVRWSLRTTQIFEGYTGAYENLGDAYLMTGEFDSATYYYRELMKATDTTAPMMIKFGNSRLGSHDTVGAIVAYEQAAQLDTASVEALNKIGNVCGMKGDFKRSNMAFMKLAKLNPEDPNPWRMLYTNYRAMGDSIKAYEAAVEYSNRGGKP